MIKDFQDYIAEGAGQPQRPVYPLLTALAVFKPESFAFLHSVKSRYTLTATELNQSLYHALLTTHEVQAGELRPGEFRLDPEKDWSKMQACVKSALAIHGEFPNLTGVEVSADGTLHVVSPEGSARIQGKAQPLNKTVFTELAGIDSAQVTRHALFTQLLRAWDTALRRALKPAYAELYAKLCPAEALTDFGTYSTHRVPGLGFRAEKMPALYYHSLYAFCRDVATVKAAFFNHENFLTRWYETVDELLNRGILLPALRGNTGRQQHFAAALNRLHGLGADAFYRFDSHAKLVRVHDERSFFAGVSSDKLHQKYYINKKHQLILQLRQGNSGTLKLMLGMESVAPSPLKIQYRHEQEN